LHGGSNDTTNIYFQIPKWYVVTDLEKNCYFFHNTLHNVKYQDGNCTKKNYFHF